VTHTSVSVPAVAAALTLPAAFAGTMSETTVSFEVLLGPCNE
jgi:hypothetical protein